MNIYSRQISVKNLWQFLLANVVLSLLILVIFFGNVFVSPERFLIGFIWSFSICITQWTGPVMIGNLLDKKFRWIDKPVKRTFIEITSLLIWSVGAFISVQLIMMYLVHGIAPSDAWQSISHSILITFLISLFISLVFTAVGFFKAWRKSVLREAELKSEMMTYKYESLRNQLNPHFLFNSFNVLSDLVYDDQAQAVKFIRQMSDLFRYVLDCRDKELVSLKEEVDFMKSYAWLLQTRFGDKLHLSITLNEDSQALIVPMTLQLLVENAVKHNEVSEKYPLHISIKQNGDFIEVENALKLKNSGKDSKNTGLRNISQQYSFFTDRQIEIHADTKTYLVRIPVIQKTEK